MNTELVDNRLQDIIEACSDLQGNEWGTNSYKMSRELYKIMERLIALEEKYRLGGTEGVSDDSE